MRAERGGEGPGGALEGMRILLAPDDIASVCTRLARGLANAGARCWLFNPNSHQYTAAPQELGEARRWAPGWTDCIVRLRTKSVPGRAAAAVLSRTQRWAVFAWSLWSIDAVVFVYNRSFLRGSFDLWVYRLLGKRVVRIFLGSDSRPRYMDGWHRELLDPATRDGAARRLARRARRQHRRVRRLSRWSDIVVENPLCGHFQERAFVNWFRIGIPHDPAAFGGQEAHGPGHQRRLRVLHCPSNPEIKGTARIERALERLEAQGVKFDYTRITGMPRAEVLQRLSECDVVIDQLYSDSPMPGFSSEAAAFGKAAIVCGYGWGALEASIPGEAMAQSLHCDPEAFESLLARVVEDRAFRERRGREAFDFVNGYWHQDAVAERFSLLLRRDDAIPDDWWCDPADISYWQGLGAPAEHRRQALVSLCELRGMEALLLPPDSPVYRCVAGWLEERAANANRG